MTVTLDRDRHALLADSATTPGIVYELHPYAVGPYLAVTCSCRAGQREQGRTLMRALAVLFGWRMGIVRPTSRAEDVVPLHRPGKMPCRHARDAAETFAHACLANQAGDGLWRVRADLFPTT